MTVNKLAISAALFALTTAAPALAYDQDAWAFGIGYTDTFGDEGFNAISGNVEYRSAPISTDYTFGIEEVSWIAGGEYDTDESAYGYGGILFDFALTDKWSITPSIAAGLYTKGDGKDLGGALSFRENLELNYKFTEESRLGLAISHKSNARIYDINPGTETVQVTYSVSLD